MQKILAILVVMLIAFAMIIPVAAGNAMGGEGDIGGPGPIENSYGPGESQPTATQAQNGPGPSENSYGPGESQPVATQAQNGPGPVENSYGPGESQFSATQAQYGAGPIGNSYGPGDGQPAATQGQYGPGPLSPDCTPQPANNFSYGPGTGTGTGTGNSYGAGSSTGTGQEQTGQRDGMTGESNNNILPDDNSLDVNETAALLFMREEEKLAHDVYTTFFTQWGLSIFQNISRSEQIHMDAIKVLLDRYQIQDPALDGVGVFSNPDLQDLYDTLIGRGSQSLSEALKVGAAIEEIDILDLEEKLSLTDNKDIQQVFTNLLSGSSNHLVAFTSALLILTGENYQPQYLGMEDYLAILATGTGENGFSGSGNAYQGGR